MNMRNGSIAVLLLSSLLLVPGAFGQQSQEKVVSDLSPPGFAYDPEKEEGPHDESDYEWWYHFGFLKSKESKEYEYSFVSSFQRNKLGRYLFYNLTDLETGKKHHYAVVDKLLGVFSLALSLSLSLPEDHEFMPQSDPPCEPPESELWLCYGNNSLQKEGDLYEVSYENEGFSLDLTLKREGPPMPVNGNGLQGLVEPEDQHYYTYPRVSALAKLYRDGKETELDGDFWYDHQWGIARTRRPMKWCWWGLRLDNGQNLSLFFVQDMKTSERVQWGFTLHHPDGQTEFYKDVTFSPTRQWTSSHERTYDVEWEIRVPEIDLVVHTQPFADDHEVSALGYEWIWEGPCKAEVSYKGGGTATGIGFQEMIGQPTAGS